MKATILLQFFTLAVCFGYLLPQRDNALTDEFGYFKAIVPPNLNEEELKLLLEDTFELIKDNDLKTRAIDEVKSRINEAKTGAPLVQGNLFIVYPDKESGNFDALYERDSNDDAIHVDRGEEVQKDTFKLVNDLDDSEKEQEFEELKRDSGAVKDTFKLVNDLDKDRESL